MKSIIPGLCFVMLSQLAPAPLPAQAAPAASKRAPAYVGQLVQTIQPSRELVYKKINGRELRLHVFEPPGKAGGPRPCFVAYHGGGWTSGSPRSMFSFTEWAAKHGMVGISVEYRRYKAGTEVTVFDCVKDARSAMRHIRAHAAGLGIDPDRIAAGGASAGGHLAAATALFTGVDEADDDLSVPCAPQALVLFSPVIDTSAEGYGGKKIGERWKELSPADRVVKGAPPTLLFHGTGDTTTPFKGAEKFRLAMTRAGNTIELVAVEGAIHTYMFKDAALYEETLRRMETFLRGLGFAGR
ncbi:MAG: alpha/beta hydrolase [Opitutaceae bacterium]|jgi:acetyl esterase/lipase|nr:alpha/beta hydrolase [Opitutaceae bacterium]